MEKIPFNYKTIETWLKNFISFLSFFAFYLKKYISTFLLALEEKKNVIVKFFLMKRGRYNRPFLHLATMSVLVIGILLAPLLADTYPIFSTRASVAHLPSPTNDEKSVSVDNNVFQTQVSKKPRDKVIDYVVEKGDTISTIADKFAISENTIRWENNLSGDSLSIGQTIRILPVTGIAYKVKKGDSIYSIAKKLNTEAQKIVDFPFNEFANPETFSLIEGQIVIVPDGIKPAEQQFIKQQVYIAQGPIPVSVGGFTWPVHGLVTQFATWYHMGIDVAAPVGTPLVAAHNGTVTKVSVGTYDYGYGNNVYISNGAGIESHYAHMMSVTVSAGQQVIGGSTVIGYIGMTGRTTGAHVHFEIKKNGVLVDPLPYLQ